MSFKTPMPIPTVATFPLDPLTLTEMNLAVQIAKKDLNFKIASTFFDRVELELPTKASVLHYQPGTPFVRKAYVGTYDQSMDKYYAYSINLTDSTINNPVYVVNIVPKARPAWTTSDDVKVSKKIKSNAAYKTALAARGITPQQINNYQIIQNTLIDGRLNSDQCTCNMPNLERNPRPRAFYASTILLDEPYSSQSLLGNWYLQPVSGVWAWVDCNSDSVLKIEDTGNIVPINQGLLNVNDPPNYYCNSLRNTLTSFPLVMKQPNGPSFNINGNQILWERWRFRYMLHPSVGLVFNLVEYNDIKNQSDPANYKSILYQANINEAITTYGSTEYGTRNFNFLDFGEYQTRIFMTPLQAGIDVPPYATFYHPLFVLEDGTVYQYENGLAIYEQDAGVLWRHYEFNTGKVQGRRNRELVLVHAACIGNYDYLYYWIFSQNGSIRCEIKLSGMDEMAAGTQGTETATLIGPNLLASNHQHFFNFRFDFSIDGQVNRVSEHNISPIDNTCKNAWVENETLLHTTGESIRNINPLTARTWAFSNHSNHSNDEHHHPAYVLKSHDCIARMAQSTARIAERALFMENNLYVTKYRENEQYFMGNYPIEKAVGEGVVLTPERLSENIIDEDLVAWFTIGFGHAPEVENFPVLNAETLKVELLPHNFFKQNPGIDVDKNTLIS